MNEKEKICKQEKIIFILNSLIKNTKDEERKKDLEQAKKDLIDSNDLEL